MPGLNRQGPEGNGPMTGRQRGMCNRTDDLYLARQRGGLGRGMGGRCRGSFFQSGPGRFAQTEVGGDQRFSTRQNDELSNLKAEYQKTQEALASLMQKIEVLENRESGSE
ncbi:DUF5320 domain-containing protein [Desulforhopalus sp. IMCC35007]|uniref:DUF5320 domain-containing protein n=1 Tax=Desulforhopalus sp. IMCC35007 TaxID=2569543 RepID=UPI0010AE3296|nr:DUF5320 domain-containing protein [Desulforhopalus sp. IMCC35007]TKB08165.1 hypothetical protein FCL48_14390 [Desulforhopalus sp. IMCC35007]